MGLFTSNSITLHGRKPRLTFNQKGGTSKATKAEYKIERHGKEEKIIIEGADLISEIRLMADLHKMDDYTKMKMDVTFSK